MVETEAWAELDPGTGKAEDRGQVTHTIQSLHKHRRLCSISCSYLPVFALFARFWPAWILVSLFDRGHFEYLPSETCQFLREETRPWSCVRGRRTLGILGCWAQLCVQWRIQWTDYETYPPTRACVTVRIQEWVSTRHILYVCMVQYAIYDCIKNVAWYCEMQVWSFREQVLFCYCPLWAAFCLHLKANIANMSNSGTVRQGDKDAQLFSCHACYAVLSSTFLNQSVLLQNPFPWCLKILG